MVAGIAVAGAVACLGSSCADAPPGASGQALTGLSLVLALVAAVLAGTTTTATSGYLWWKTTEEIHPFVALAGLIGAVAAGLAVAGWIYGLFG